MGSVVAVVSIVLALVAAGSIAYIAWELTSEDKPHPEKNEPPEQD
jgi:hypothetical protein